MNKNQQKQQDVTNCSGPHLNNYGSFTPENLTSCIKFGWYLNDYFLNSDERDADVVNNTRTAP